MDMKQERHNFILKAVSLRPSLRFQYYYNNLPSATWFNYKECLERHPYLFIVNDKILRTSIENDSLSEYRIDIDSKDEFENKSLKLSIIEALTITDILKDNNIKYSMYYSGGNGIHIHFLFTCLKMPNINRKKLKLLIAKQLNISNLIDPATLSSNTMFGCEGYQHRKTNNYKIYIDTNKYNRLGSILNFIEENSHKIIINNDFFSEINDLTSIINGLSIPKPINNKIPSQIRSNRINSKKIKSYMITFIELYKSKGVTSTHFYPLMVCKYLLSEGLGQEEVKEHLELFISKCNINFTKNIDNFIVDISKIQDKRIFIFCNPNAERFYFTFSEFIEKNNFHMSILTKGVL